MAMLLNKPGRGRGRKRQLQAEINVTPFVDVMLVLLIVFMITARLLLQGVDVNLPKASADTLPIGAEQPMSISLRADGKIYLQTEEIEREALVPKLRAVLGTGYDQRIYVRGDRDVSYGGVMELLTQIQQGGFSNVSLVTDPLSDVE